MLVEQAVGRGLVGGRQGRDRLLPYKGVYAPLSDSIDRGFQVALAEYGGKIAGRPVEIIRADDELTPSVGVQKFNKFVQLDKVDLVAGVVSSSVAIAVSVGL